VETRRTWARRWETIWEWFRKLSALLSLLALVVASTEWQGNFKLAYALETLPDQTFRMRCNYEPPGYPAANRDLPITGPQMVERFFAMFGDVYLADPKREWTTLTSDEMHTFFQRLKIRK
jgi:hypothetical protein